MSTDLVTETGDNLDILVYAELSQDWLAFAAWYSANKNLPDAKVSLAICRSKDVPFQSFQWAKRLNVMHWYRNRNESCDDRLQAALGGRSLGRLQRKKLLIVDAATLFTNVLDQKSLDFINSTSLWVEPGLHLVGGLSDDELSNTIFERSISESEEGTPKLCCQAKEMTGRQSIVNYIKGCGRWIDTMKGCPFSSASGMIIEGMTVNEHRIIELWKKMVPVYNAVH
jgi:hypothetical protein